MNAYVGVDTYIRVFYTPVIVGVLSASSLGRFTPRNAVPILNYIITML
jgi:hypothetical protein